MAKIRDKFGRGLDISPDSPEGFQILREGGKLVEAPQPGVAGVAPGGTDIPYTYPRYEAQVGENGLILDKYRLLADPSLEQQTKGYLGDYVGDLNTQGLQALRTRALSQAPSAWANLATQAQRLEEQGARDLAQRTGAGQRASAWSQLASRGGLSGGERERIATESMRGVQEGLQNVALQGAQS